MACGDTSISHKLTTWCVDKLRPHPSYAQLGLKVPTSKLNMAIEQDEDAIPRQTKTHQIRSNANGSERQAGDKELCCGSGIRQEVAAGTNRAAQQANEEPEGTEHGRVLQQTTARDGFVEAAEIMADSSFGEGHLAPNSSLWRTCFPSIDHFQPPQLLINLRTH